MITPSTITNFNRTEAELEEFLMFAILVAGKGAEQQAKKLDAYLKTITAMDMGLGKKWTPFNGLEYTIQLEDFFRDHHKKEINLLDSQMKKHKLGQYNRIGNAFREILKFKGRLKKVTIEELESVKGIGSKTARFFVLHSRPDAQVAVLDTHILKWLNEKGYKGIPKATPPKKKYAEIEKLFLTEAIIHQMTPADLDLTIWKSYATKA
jgi:thermostable 8-oxoguanine DNA glycosylase